MWRITFGNVILTESIFCFVALEELIEYPSQVYNVIPDSILYTMPRTIDEIVRDYFAIAKINVNIIKFGPMLTSGVYPVLVRNQNDITTRRFKSRCPDLTTLGYNNELVISRTDMHLRFSS